MPTCLPTPPFCASVSLLAPTLMAQQGVWKGLVYFLGGSSYPKCGGLALNPLPTLYGQGHKAGGGSRASRGRRSCQALNQYLPGSVSPGYSSTTFSMLRCRLQPPSPANPSPGWRGGARFGTCLLISSTRAALCLPAGHPPSPGSCAGMLPLRSSQLEGALLHPSPPSLHCSRADLGLCSTFQ